MSSKQIMDAEEFAVIKCNGAAFNSRGKRCGKEGAFGSPAGGGGDHHREEQR